MLDRPSRWHNQTLQTFFDVCTIEITGHPRCGGSIDCEVEFTMTPVIPARTYGPPEAAAPASGGEIEITAVRPFERSIDPTTGRLGTKREYLDCPRWLEEILMESIDPDLLSADE